MNVNERKVGHPIIHMNTIRNATLFMHTPTMSGTTRPIRQLRRHVLRSFLEMSCALHHEPKVAAAMGTLVKP